jgi:hypothetical protein
MNNLLANIVIIVHISYFVFVLGGIIAILIGPRRNWKWTRNIWFRLLHIAAVYVVVLEDIFHFECPLNTMEWKLRPAAEAGAAATATPSGITGSLDFLLRHTIPGPVLHLFYWSAAVFLLASLIGDWHRIYYRCE